MTAADAYENLYVVDTETGGIVPGEVPVIEVAYGPVTSEALTVLWNDDARAEHCDPAALVINKCFDVDRPHPAQTERMSAIELAERIRRDLAGKVLVAANPQIDADRMHALLAAHVPGRVGPPWSYRLVDLKSLAVGFLAAQGKITSMPSNGWSQKDVADMLPIPAIPDELAHTAAGDVSQVRSIVRHILGIS